MTTTTPAPVAVVIRVRELRGGTRVVSVACPFCGHRHHHGWPYGAPDVGPRVAHCHRPQGGPARSYDVHVAVTGGVR